MNNINRNIFVAGNIPLQSESNDLSNSYFTIEALEDNLTAKLSVNACEYCVDNSEWKSLTADTNTVSINKGQTLSFRGNLTPTSSIGIGTFTISKKCNVRGNMMSLLYGDDFEGQTDLTGKNYAFYLLFYNCSNIIDASQLILPATTLAGYCYEDMFNGCTSLVITPALPATTLTEYCYCRMFQNCTSLVTAPELPATSLATSCYSRMFQNCTSLVTAPELPATSLASECYSGMFSICTSLTQAPSILPATTLVYKCYRSMFASCASLVTAPELPATSLATECYGYMFNGCSSLTQAPELPATRLDDSCYRSMFNGCTKLNYIKALFTTTPSTSYTYSWVSGVSSTGTFVKNAKAIWNVTGSDGIPSGWTVETI